MPAQRAGYGERMTRLIWQDHETGGLYWGEVFQGQAWTVTASPVRDFPKLTAGEQSLVQMDRVDEFVLAGVRGNADGSSGSGWVALDIGVRGYRMAIILTGSIRPRREYWFRH